MPNYSLNNAVPEPERFLQDRGFNGMHHETHPPTAYETSDSGAPPGQLPSPLHNQVNPSSDTQTEGIPEAAGDITRRTRNG